MCSARQHAQAAAGTGQPPGQEGRGSSSPSWWVSCTQGHQSPQQTQEGLNSCTQNRAASEKLTPFPHFGFLWKSGPEAQLPPHILLPELLPCSWEPPPLPLNTGWLLRPDKSVHQRSRVWPAHLFAVS